MNKLTQLFKKESLKKDFSKLEKSILKQVEIETRKKAKQRLIVSYIGLSLSALTTIFVFSVFGKNLWQSEFWSMLSLLFSDAGIILNYWQQFGLSLLETLPAFGILIVLSPILVLFVFLGYYIDSLKLKNNFLTN